MIKRKKICPTTGWLGLLVRILFYLVGWSSRPSAARCLSVLVVWLSHTRSVLCVSLPFLRFAVLVQDWQDPGLTTQRLGAPVSCLLSDRQCHFGIFLFFFYNNVAQSFLSAFFSFFCLFSELDLIGKRNLSIPSVNTSICYISIKSRVGSSIVHWNKYLCIDQKKQSRISCIIKHPQRHALRSSNSWPIKKNES